MKNAALHFLIGVVLLIMACSEETLEKPENYIIEFGTACGWCGGTEFILINSSKIEYEKKIPCGSEKGETKKERQISSEEWEVLVKSMNYKTYLSLDYNECHTCYDGCDEIIKVTLNDSVHKLQYLPLKSIKEIEVFQKTLTGLMEEMRNK